MKKIKVLSGTALAGLLAAVSLTSCGTDNSHTIDFYTTAGDDLMAILNVAKDDFEKENSGWTVKITNGFSYDTLKTKVTSTLSANTQPSLAYCYPDHVASYLKTGKVLNLQNYIDNSEYGYSKEEWSDFISTYMTEGTSYVQDGTYSIPMARSTEVLYYNKTVLDANKIAVPTTWDELWDACAKLKALYPKSTPLGYDSESNWIITYLEQYQNKNNAGKLYTDGKKSGSEKILFNNDVSKAFLKEIKDKFDNGYFTTKSILNSYTSSLFTKYDVKNDNKASYQGSFFSIGSTGGASKQEPASGAFDAAVTALPGIDAKNNQTISQGPSLVMFDQGSDEKAVATWKFVKVLLSTKIQASYSVASGYNPIRNSVYSDEGFNAGLETKEGLVKDCILLGQTLGASNSYFTSDAFHGSSVARTQIGTCVVNVLKITKGQVTDQKIEDFLKESYDETVYYTK